MGKFCKTHVVDRTDSELRECAIHASIYSEAKQNAKNEIRARCERQAPPEKPCIGTIECNICGRFYGNPKS